jgi:hypothetical protein
MTATSPDPAPADKPPPGQLRASDADRHQIAERLQAALEEGRLELLEYDERLKSAYAARTYDELNELIADLPPASAVELHKTSQPVPQAPPRPGVARRLGGTLAQPHWRSWAGTGVILLTIWLVTSIASREALFFWPMFPLGIWGAVLVAGTIWGDGDAGGKKGHRRPERDSGHGERRDSRPGGTAAGEPG